MGFTVSEKKDIDHATRKTSLERYNVTCAEKHIFCCRKWLKPFKPTYELEWQEHQWLQLDATTSQHIERMRTRGFSRMLIRNDRYLRQHVRYSNPHEFDVLLELSFDIQPASNSQKIRLESNCQHRFMLRRVFWWRSKYGVGEAYLPESVDKSQCCSHALMNQRTSLDKANFFPSLEYITPPNILDNTN
ncbi:hypothetical protein A0J61_04014 [Choanephora cucurbitarum]|uniref:Uncharacterized protein n=1 Tax=Choanephora cucurbitarum TaxID=101091 RepID=A0A1C7NGP5_9FUNG|nr:hypothetical protein A0J61_04014 [Choanephora cucurbitarum]